MGSTQELSCARAELAAWLKEDPGWRTSNQYFIERYQSWEIQLYQQGKLVGRGSKPSEAEAIEAALKAARGRG